VSPVKYELGFYIPEDGIIYVKSINMLRDKKFPIFIKFEVFTTVTMKNNVFWDVTPCDSCKGLQEPHGVTSQKTPFFPIFLYGS
jgi:hypothetical protein